MSLPEQLNIHSLFQSMTLFEGNGWEEPLDGANDEDASCEEHVPDLVWSNLTESNNGLNDHSHLNDDDDEESIVSVDTSLDDSCSESHYETRLKATQKLISDCVITGKSKETLDNRSPSVEEETFFPINVPARDPVPDPMVRTCFDSVHLLSPTYFACPEQQQKPLPTKSSPVKQEKPSTLSSMIHPMSLASLALVTPSGPSSSVTTSDTPRTVQTIRSSIRKEGSGIRQHPRLQSAFKSSLFNESIEYCLSTGKQGMSPHLRRRSRKLLPEDLTKRMSDEESSTTKENCRSRLFDSNNEPIQSLHLAPDSQSSLSILLLECHQKVFEIVAVDHVTAETSVGDVLSRARSQATDPRLSRQTYTSLCNSVNEMAAMMLPVHLMMDVEQSTGNRERKRKEPTLQKYDRLEAARKTCDDLGRLLVAVPEGSSAEAVREIQKTLWCHPRVQRWWRKENQYFGKRDNR
jgi:hypothetical protein